MVKKITPEEKQTFISHLKELRDRIVVCIIAVGIAFVLAYYFKEKIFYFLMKPFIAVMPEKSSFIFTYVTEPLSPILRSLWLQQYLLPLR